MKYSESSARSGDIVAGLFIILIAVGGAWQAASYSLGTAGRMGPGYFPMALSGMMLIIGVLILFVERLPQSQQDGFDPRIFRPILTILAAMLAFALMIERFGLIPSVFVTSMVSSMAERNFKWLRAVIVAVLLASGSTAVFKFGLNLYVDIIKW